jgi:hypothetical protein
MTEWANPAGLSREKLALGQSPWTLLTWFFNYLRITLHLPLQIEARSLDASFLPSGHPINVRRTPDCLSGIMGDTIC